MLISYTCVPPKSLFTRQLHSLPLHCSFFFRFRFVVFVCLSSIKVIQPSFVSAGFFFSFLPPVLRWGMQSVKHQLPHPLHCLEPSSLTARQLGIGFHSNRPSTDPSVRPLPSLRDHSTGALSPLHSSQTPSPHIA